MNLFKSILRVLVSVAVLLGLSSHAVNAQVSNAPIVIAAKVNINEAPASAIANVVKGIGVKRAQAIVEYRQNHGKFTSFNDLAKVKGISERYISKHLAEMQRSFSL